MSNYMDNSWKLYVKEKTRITTNAPRIIIN